MTPEEAADNVTFLRSAFPQIDDARAEFYRGNLASLQAKEGSNAILNGIKVWKYAPSWAEVIEFYKIERLKTQTAEQRPIITGPPSAIPLWVRRWIAARYLYASFGRDKDMRRFPEQFNQPGEPDPAGPMPDTEWVEEAAHVSDDRVWGTILA